METREDNSAGIILTYAGPEHTQSFCLVHHATKPDGSGGHWAFPKGHIDAGESKEGAARRELYEETGIMTCKIDPERTFVERYSFNRDGVRFDKEVTYFLGSVETKDPVAPMEVFKGEIIEARWVSYYEAKELLTFPQAKELLEEVCGYLKTRT